MSADYNTVCMSFCSQTCLVFYCMSMFSCHQACMEDSGYVSADYNMADEECFM